MAMSGVKVEDRVQDEFREMKHGKQLNRFIQMHIDKGEICIEKCASKSDTPRGYEEFVEQLPADDCRYAFVDFHYEDPEKGPQDKLVFVNWCPDTAKVGKKMLYASSKDAIKNKVGGGIAAEIQACDFDEVSPEAVLDKLKTKK